MFDVMQELVRVSINEGWEPSFWLLKPGFITVSSPAWEMEISYRGYCPDTNRSVEVRFTPVERLTCIAGETTIWREQLQPATLRALIDACD